ncbi:MAG: SdrD B-like domain-containing protein, partial [Acidimicrobiia bacterium]
GYDAGKPIGAQNLPASDGNSATGFLASGEIATVTVDFGTQNLEPLDKMVNTVRGTFGNSYAGGTAESDSPPLPADFNAGATITMYDGVIGNVLFADLNANGMKDAGEPGIPNVTLELLDAAGLPAVDADGVPIPNVTTNGSGQYVFVGLMPGTYKVRVLAAELSAGGDLLGARISPIAGNPDDNRDEAVDQHLLTGFVTGPMTLSIGGEPTGEPDSSGLVPAGVRDVDTNLTMDLGVVPPAALTLTKSASPTKIHSGGSVNYTFVARSTGGALHNVSMTDSDLGCAPTLVSGDTNSNSILETSETWTYTCTLLNVTDALDGTSNTDHTNTANVTGLDVLNATVSNSASATVDIIASTIAVVKSASKSAIREGDTVTYTFDVTSTGDPLSNVTLSDSDAPCNTTLTGPTGDDNTNSKLDAGEIWHYTCSVVVTDALDGTTNTDHTNTVTVHGDDPLSLQMTNTATKTIDIVSSTIKVVKSASPNVIHEGDPVMYTFVVTSTGDPVDHVALSDTDAACNGSLSGPTGDTGTAGVLIPGETWTYTCTVASVTDALDGATGTTHTNTVTVNAEDPSGASISDDDTVTVDIVASTIAVTKVGNPKSIHEGDTVTYTFEVTGTGDPISSVTVVDTDAACNSSMSGPTGDNGDGIFQAGETWKYTCDVAVTDALDGTTNTDHTNTVTASGKDLAGTTISANASETVDIVASQIGVTKTANVDPIHEGDTVTYTFHVTNVGDPISNVTLNDTDSACNTSLVGPTGGDGNAFLDDGEEWTYTCDVTVTDALDGTTNTDHTNTVTATGDDPAGVSSTADATETVDIVGSSLDISKTPSTLALHEGETVTYTFVVTGHGDPQHNVTVSDSDAACNTSLAGPTGGDGNAFLNDGEGWTYTCVVVVTDALDGTALTDHTNTVDARALDPLGNPATATAQATVDIVGATLNVVKSANPTRIHEGGTVTYSFDVTTALDPIWNVTLSDTDAPCNASMTAPTGDDGDSILQVGEIWHYTCTVIVTDALDGTTNTDHTNTATVNGEDSLGAPLTWTDGEIVDIIGSKVAITKTPSLPAIHTGESVTYTFVATLVGDPVTSPTINDSDTQCNASMSTPSGDTNNDGILQATEQWTYTCTLAVTDALDGSSNTDHTNTVQFSGIDPLLRTESASTTATVNIVGSDLSLKKTATPKAIMPGESVTYTFELTATGDPVSNPVVTDSQCTVSALTGDANGNGKVDQGETWTGTCTVANVTDATDGTANSMHTNTANANGTDPLGAPLVATANAEVRFLGSLGDYVWSDINHDGQQSTSEPAIGGVKVELYECADGNSATCTLLRTTTTDTSGRYLFDRLAAGHYQLKFIAPDGTIPTDMAMGGSTGSDSDIAGDGRTLVIDLKAGERNMTLDAGYTSAFNLLLDKSVQGGDAQTDLSPGDKVAFVIDVSNDGQGAVPAEVHMNDPLPAGMTYVSHTAPDGWTCSVTNNTLSCIKPNMLAGERSSFTITATLDATAAGGDLKNVANVTTIGVEGKTTDNQHTAEIVVKGTDSNAVPPAQPAPLTPNRVPPADTTRAALPYTGRDLWEEALVAFGLIALGGLASITSQRRRRKLRLPTDWAQAFRCPDCC